MSRDRLWLSQVLPVPVVLFSGTFLDLLGYDWQFTGLWLIPLAFGIAVFR